MAYEDIVLIKFSKVASVEKASLGKQALILENV